MGKKTTLAIISGAEPTFLGGISLYIQNLIPQLPKETEITWYYKGNKDRTHKKKGVTYKEIKVPHKGPHKGYLQKEFVFNKKIKKELEQQHYDIINSHAIWGYWMKHYKKKKEQKIIHTYHGSTYHYYKKNFERYNHLLRYTLQTILLTFAKIIEKPPMKKADKVICVSKKVTRQLQELHGKRKNITTIRTGVNTKQFNNKKKQETRKKLGLKEKTLYALYVGQGGYWTKGLDRAITLTKELRKKHNIKLIAIGPDKQKCKHLLKEPFIIYKKQVERKNMPQYYKATDIFYCLSRYEGGAPTLVLTEAMATENLAVCSKDSEQEIIKHKENGIIINNYKKQGATIISNIIHNKKEKRSIEKKAKKTIQKYHTTNWSKKYIKELYNKKT